MTTAAISWSANTTTLANNIEAALAALTNIGPGNTVVSNATNPTITFVNALAGSGVPTMTYNDSGLLPASPPPGNIISLITTQSGVSGPLQVLYAGFMNSAALTGGVYVNAQGYEAP